MLASDAFVLYGIVVMVCFIYNPIMTVFLPRIGISDFTLTGTYVRFFGLIPIFATMAYALCDAAKRLGKSQRAAVVVIAIAIAISGMSFSEIGKYNRAENIYHIAQEGVTIADMITGDYDSANLENAEDEIYIIVDTDSLSVGRYVKQRNENYLDTIRQYEPRLVLQGSLFYPEKFEINGERGVNQFLKNREETDYKYIVVGNSNPQLQVLEHLKFYVVGQTDNYTVLRRPEVIEYEL
ncbi:MAG: hypothetical protein PUB19_08725 [Lachnospiraceae bacterium]|nr:hypothetical protein [Lachnospiraceae bacterium]